ncbi:MAG TPA: heparan-alpha-glucosaminide N-acetyltransferase domain-containing protein [Thermoanaerobaculia bacterium]
MSDDGHRPRPGRIVALDALRGLTIAGMLVVNTPGTWANVYPPLLHAEWHGWTYTDTIFPFFLFVVGVSLVLSFERRGGRSRSALPHLLLRTALIFGLGLALNLSASLAFGRASIRIPGVLQRIAVCYLFASLIYLVFGRKGVFPAAAALLLGYWLLMACVPVPGYGAGRLDVEGNLARHIDQLVLGDHTWKHNPNWDPEGLLSTLPAIATTLLGILAGLLLQSDRPLDGKITRLLAWGWLGGIVGLIWNLVFPINKNLWTSSYAVFMSGLASAALGVCVWAIDRRGWKAWAIPFVWLGSNALALFVAGDALAFLLLAVKVGQPPRSLYTAIYQTIFDHFADPRFGSVLFALAYCGLWIAVAGWLYRRRIFIKV